MEHATILVLGSGAREHALARAIAASPASPNVVVAPGNGGIAATGRVSREHVDSNDLGAVVALAKRLNVTLVVVGPEAPLVAGVVDALAEAGILAFGPTKAAARLEASKAFLKEFATRHAIPTAPYAIVSTVAEAEREIRARGAPIVIKADGLCAGKGVVVATTVDEAIAAARSMLEAKVFGDAGARVVIEARIDGREVSVHAVSDGERIFVLPPARDHKRIFDGDRGPNTGGMGVVCPPRDVDSALMERIRLEILEPTIAGARAEGFPFRGVLFAGVMVDGHDKPFLLEHNVRFGDPECEAMLELVEGDVAGLLASAASGALRADAVTVRTGEQALVIVLAARNYPARPELGADITGIAEAEAFGARVYHAGTVIREGRLEVAGGRVLAVTARAQRFAEARDRAYAAAEAVQFVGKQFRSDIGVHTTRTRR